MQKILITICFSFLFTAVIFPQEQVMCPLEFEESTIVEPTIGTENLAVVFVDFPEGRMPDGSMPLLTQIPITSQLIAR